MSELMVKHGFAIRRAFDNGKTDIRLRPSRGGDGWSIWKTRRNAEAALFNKMDAHYTETVIPVTMRLDFRQELDTRQKEVSDGDEG